MSQPELNSDHKLAKWL